MEDFDPERGAIAPRPATPGKTEPRSYHVALTPKEVIERLCELPGVKAYESRMLPDFGGLIEDGDYTLELGTGEFTLHVGPPAARGQSATGMLRLLYLHGRLIRTEDGTLIELGFTHRRPQWAMQRWFGFLALASLGLVWVLVGPGLPGKKALLYGLLMLVLGPVIIHDLRRGDRFEDQRKAMLNLLEHSFGPIQIDEPHHDEPYRRRQLGAGLPASAREDLDEDEDEDE